MKKRTGILIALLGSAFSVQAALVTFDTWTDQQHVYTLDNVNADGVSMTLTLETAPQNLNAAADGDTFGLNGGQNSLRVDPRNAGTTDDEIGLKFSQVS